MQLYAAPFEGIEGTTVAPIVLAMYQGVPVYLDATGQLRTVAEQGGNIVVGNLPPQNAPVAAITSLRPGPNGVWRLEWRTETARGWSDVNLETGTLIADNSADVNVSELPVYIEHRAQLSDPNPWVHLQMVPDAVNVTWQSVASSRTFTLPAIGNILQTVPYGDRVLIIGDSELYEVNLMSFVDDIGESQ